MTETEREARRAEREARTVNIDAWAKVDELVRYITRERPAWWLHKVEWRAADHVYEVIFGYDAGLSWYSIKAYLDLAGVLRDMDYLTDHLPA